MSKVFEVYSIQTAITTLKNLLEFLNDKIEN